MIEKLRYHDVSVWKLISNQSTVWVISTQLRFTRTAAELLAKERQTYHEKMQVFEVFRCLVECIDWLPGDLTAHQRFPEPFERFAQNIYANVPKCQNLYCPAAEYAIPGTISFSEHLYSIYLSYIYMYVCICLIYCLYYIVYSLRARVELLIKHIMLPQFCHLCLFPEVQVSD